MYDNLNNPASKLLLHILYLLYLNGTATTIYYYKLRHVSKQGLFCDSQYYWEDNLTYPALNL